MPAVVSLRLLRADDPEAVPPPTLSLHAAVAYDRAEHRLLIAAASAWARRRRCTLPEDHVALIMAATSPWRRGGRPAVPMRWTRTGVNHCRSVLVRNSCALASCPVPAGLATSLGRFLAFLAETGRLDPASDPLAELQKPLVCYGRHGDGCDCYRPYCA